MRMLSLVFAAALFASTLAADEAAIKNANDFLAGLDKIDAAILGDSRYKLKVQGRKLGSMTLKIAESKYEQGPCYRAEASMDMAFGGDTYSYETTGFTDHKLRLLFGSSISRSTGDPTEHSAVQLTPDGYVSSESNEDGELESYRYETVERLVEGTGELILVMLLPHEAGKSYEFQRWSEKQGHFPVTYTVDGEKKVGDVTGIVIREEYTKIEEDDKGKDTTVDVVNTYLISNERRMLRMTASDKPLSIEYDDGRWTKEEVEQMANPLDPVMAFWMSLRDKDVDLLKLALNEERYMEEYTKREEGEDSDTDWMNDILKKTAEETLAPAMLENIDMDDHLKLIVDGISATWFEVSMDGENKAKVGFGPEFEKTTGDSSVMWWHLEKNTETGKWELVYLETEEDEF